MGYYFVVFYFIITKQRTINLTLYNNFHYHNNIFRTKYNSQLLIVTEQVM